MEIIGKHTETVKIEVSAHDCLKAVAKELGVSGLVYGEIGSGYRVREVRDKSGKLVKLITEHDISYHGSSCWEPYGKPIEDTETLGLYKSFKFLEKKLSEKK